MSPLGRTIVMVLLSAACAGCYRDVADPDAPHGPTHLAQSYLDEVVGIMKTNSTNSLTIDWTYFTEEVQRAAGNAQTIQDTYPAIQVALGLLGDGHSSFRTVQGNCLGVATRYCTAPIVGDVTSRPADIGYVRVHRFSGSADQATQVAQALQDSIRAQDHQGIRGWIVDLGGNMWPMISGVGPAGATPWGYRDGEAWLAGSVLQRVSSAYHTVHELPRVAVLTNNLVASSGEAVAIAFHGRVGARSFGSPTCGLSSSNRGFSMSDGALLNLTVAVMADRTGRGYGDVVEPDRPSSAP